MDGTVLLLSLLVFSWMKPTDVVSDTVLHCPATSVDAEIGETVILQCLTVPQMNVNDMTVEWVVHDTNDLVHAQRKGKQKREDQRKEYRGRTSLFDNELSKGNCSLRLTVQMSDSGRYRCYVIGEEIHSCFTYLTVHEKINSSGFINNLSDTNSPGSGQPGGDGKPGNDTSALSPHVIAAISVIAIIAIIAVVISIYIKRRKEQNKQNINEEEMRPMSRTGDADSQFPSTV